MLFFLWNGGYKLIWITCFGFDFLSTLISLHSSQYFPLSVEFDKSHPTRGDVRIEFSHATDAHQSFHRNFYISPLNKYDLSVRLISNSLRSWDACCDNFNSFFLMERGILNFFMLISVYLNILIIVNNADFY